MYTTTKKQHENQARASPLSDARILRLECVGNKRRLPLSQQTEAVKDISLRRIKFGSWNIGTMNSKSRELADVLRRRKIDIACIQETKWKGQKAKYIGDGYKLYFYGTETHRNGVGIVLSEEFQQTVVDVKRINDRIMAIQLCYKSTTINVISAYAPQSGCSEAEKECFWKELEDVLSQFGKEGLVIIGADLNGHVGKSREGFERNHGGRGYGLRNEGGTEILEIAQAFDLAIGNTYFKKRQEHLITYKSGSRTTQIDFFLVNRAHLKYVQNVKVIPSEILACQHKLLVMDFILKGIKGQKVQRVAATIQWRKLKDNIQHFQEQVIKHAEFKENTSCEDQWNGIAATMRKAGRQILGESKPTKRILKETWWWNEDVQKCIKEKKRLYKIWYKSKDSNDRQAYQVAKRSAKKFVAKAKSKVYDDINVKLNSKEGEKLIYKIAKSRARNSKDYLECRLIKGQKGEILTHDSHILQRWYDYYSDLSIEKGPVVEDINQENTIGEVNTADWITETEVKVALGKLKSGKALGPDNIPIEGFKALGNTGAQFLANLFNNILKTGVMPNEWRDSYMIPIYKMKGDIQDCNNYRGIKLMSHTFKVWEKVIEKRLRSLVQIRENQFGFMPERSTADALNSVRRLMERFKEREEDLHMCFIDLEKAFDKVPRTLVWKCLKENNVPELYVRAIKDMYKGNRTYVRTTVGTTKGFAINTGVHQGSALSPFLFIMIMDIITKDMGEEAPWAMIFADDIILCAKSEQELANTVNRWVNAIEESGLRVNRKKTEYMKTKFKSDENQLNGSLTLGDWQLTSVDSFKYLGSTLQSDGGMDKEILARINSGWLKWRDLTGVLCDKNIPRRLKGALYKSIIQPTVLYSSESWAIRKREEQRLATMEMRMLRWVLGVSKKEHRRNEEIRRILGTTSITTKLLTNRLRWYGHVERRDDSYVGKKIEMLHFAGKRRRGRPKLTWIHKIRHDMKVHKIKKDLCKDRNKWKRMLKGLTTSLGDKQS